jgi:hypothetical protein
MKGKRTLGSLRDAVSTTLANAKIAANTQAADYRAKQAWCRENAATYGFLFMDMSNIIGKPMEDFQLVITSRIADHKRAEEAKAETERARIREEERVKAEKAAAETIRLAQVESDRLAAAAAQVERERAAADTQRQLAEQASQHTAERAVEPVAQVATPKPTAPIATRRAPAAAATVPAPNRPAPAPDLLDAAADDLYPSDSDILDVMFEQFGLTAAEAIDRLAKFDFAAARAGLVAEAA